MAELQQKTVDPKSSNSENLISEVYTGSAEASYFKSPLVPDSYKTPYNPDDLWQKTGDYAIYEDMLKDDQISVCSNLKKDLIIGSGHTIISEDEAQEEIVKDLECAFGDECEVPFSEYLEEILSAHEFGFSLTEKIFKVNDEGKLRLKALRTRHPNSWLIHQDDKGNVTKYQQNTSDGFVDINPKALIHYVNNRKFQNPYGLSDLRAAYNAWFAKRQVIRYYAIYLESAAKPIPVARYHKDAPESAVTKIHNIIKNFQSKTSITIPKELEVEFLESKTNGEAYHKAINIFNMFIGRALFIPDLLGFSGGETGGGSHALGKDQISIFLMHIARARASLEFIVNTHLVKPLVVYNFGFQEAYPKFKFKPIDDTQATEFAKTWLEAIKAKVFKPNDEEINHFRKLVKFPEGEIQIEEPQPNPLLPGQMPNGMPGALPKEEPNVAKNKGDEKDAAEKAPKAEANKKAEFGKIFDQVPGDYYKKVDFKAIANKLDDYDQSIKDEVEGLIRKQFADLYDQIEKKKILTSQKVERIDDLKLKDLKALKQALKSSFMGIYKDGQTQAQAELYKSEFRAPITSEKFLEVLEAETFAYVGDYEYKILQKVRNELVAAIKDGRSLASVIDVLDDSGKSLARSSLERFARTKHTEVLNKGRLEFFEDSGVVAAYQYSAILDDRTSEICRGLHGKIFKSGEQPIPPMHFNCRSTLIPITKYEAFKETESIKGMSPQKFIEENVGEGFAVK